MSSQLSAAAHAMLYESRGTITDLVGIAEVVTLQSGLHIAETSVVQLKNDVYRLQHELQDALIREYVLQGRLRTRSKAAASVRKAMLEDLLAVRSQLQYYEHTHNTNHGDTGTSSSVGPPMGDRPYDYASYLNIGRLLEGDEDGLGVDDSAYLPNDVIVVQQMLFGQASERLRRELTEQKARIRAVCDDRVATTEAKIRRMRVQFQEACRVQQECESRISDAQLAAERRIQDEIESTAAVTTEYIRKFKDEAEATIDQLSVKVSDVTMLLETAQAENEVLAERLERMQHTKKAVAAKQITELEQNLDLLYRQVLGKEEELTSAKKLVKEHQASLESQKQRADILQEELRRRSDVIETLDQTVSDLKREKEKMARTFRDDLQRAKDNMEEEIVRRVAEAHPPTDPAELEEKCQEILELKDIIADAEQQVQTLQASLQRAQDAKRDQTVANLAAVERLESDLVLERRRSSEALAAVEVLEQKLQSLSSTTGGGSAQQQTAASLKTSFGDAIVQMQRLSLELLERARSGPLRGLMAAVDMWDVAMPQGSALRGAVGDAVDQAVVHINTMQQQIEDAEVLLVANCEHPCVVSIDGSTSVFQALWSSIAAANDDNAAGNAWQARGRVLSGAVKAIPLDGRGTQTAQGMDALWQRELDAANAIPAWQQLRAVRCKTYEHICTAASTVATAAATQPVSVEAAAPLSQTVTSSLGAVFVEASDSASPPQQQQQASMNESAVNPTSPKEPNTTAGGVGTSSKRTSAKATGSASASKRPSSVATAATNQHRRVSIADPPEASSCDISAATGSGGAVSPMGASCGSRPATDDKAVQCSLLDTHQGAKQQLSTCADVDGGQTLTPLHAPLSGPNSVVGTAALTTDQAVQTADEMAATEAMLLAVAAPAVAAMVAGCTQTDVCMDSSSTVILHAEVGDAVVTTSSATTRPTSAASHHPNPRVSTTLKQQQQEEIAIDSGVCHTPPAEDPRVVVQRLVQGMPLSLLVSSVIPRGLRADAALELLHLLPPQERRTFTSEAETKQLIPARVSHISVQRNDDCQQSIAGDSGGAHPSALPTAADDDTTRGAVHVGTVGAALRVLLTALPNFIHTAMDAVVQCGDVGALCRAAALGSVSSLLTALPFDRVAANADPETKAAFARATAVVDAAARPATTAGLHRELATAIRWLSVVQWGLRDCLQRVEEAVDAALCHQQQLAVAHTTPSGPQNGSHHGNSSGSLRGATQQVTAVGSGASNAAAVLVETSRAPHPVGIRHQRPPSANSTSMGVYERLTNTSFGGTVHGAQPPPSSVAVWGSAAQKLSTLTTKHNEHFSESKQQPQQPWPLSPTTGGAAVADVKAMYRHGRADIAPAGHMMPRQFTMDFDVAVRHSLDAAELLQGAGGDTMPLCITPTTTTPAMVGAKMTLPPRAASANGYVSRQKQQAAATRLLRINAQQAGGRSGGPPCDEGLPDDNDDGGAEWTAENTLFDDFRKQKQLEKAVLNNHLAAVTSPTIRCGSAPLQRGANQASNGPSDDDVVSRSAVVYQGRLSDQQTSTGIVGAVGAGAVPSQRVPIVTTYVRPGKVLTTTASRPGSTGGGVRSITPSTVVQPPLPMPQPETVSSGGQAVAHQRRQPPTPAVSGGMYSSKLRQAVQSSSNNNASVSATLSQVIVPTNRTQRRTTPPASVFQWQKVTSAEGVDSTMEAMPSFGASTDPSNTKLQRPRSQLQATQATNRKLPHAKQTQLQQSLDDQVLASIGTPIQEWADAMPHQDAEWCDGASYDLPSSSFSLVGTK